MTTLTDVTIAFLQTQVAAGVDAIQVFDSWAGTLSLADYRSYVLPHSSRVFASLAGAGVPMTHFGVGTAELLGAMSEAGASRRRRGLAHVADRRRRAGSSPAPRCRATSTRWCCWPGWPVVERAVRAVVEDGRRAVDAGAAGHVFNLGHGVLPGTDPGGDHRRGGVGAFAVSASYCVVGGGISGLVAAYRLRVAAGPDASITLFDPADRLGGVLRTERVGGQLMDVGAEAFVARRPEVPALLAELGLAGRQIGTTGVRPLIYSQGRLHPLPHGHPPGHSGAAGGAGRAGRRRDDRAHARRAHPPVQLAAGCRSVGGRPGR